MDYSYTFFIDLFVEILYNFIGFYNEGELVFMLSNTEKTMDKIVALCKNRGFIFAGSDIYGGLANTWDYGPL